MSQNIKEGVEGKPVEWYSQVFEHVFKDVDRQTANSMWKKQLARPPKEENRDEDEHADDLNPST